MLFVGLGAARGHQRCSQGQRRPLTPMTSSGLPGPFSPLSRMRGNLFSRRLRARARGDVGNSELPNPCLRTARFREQNHDAMVRRMDDVIAKCAHTEGGPSYL